MLICDGAGFYGSGQRDYCCLRVVLERECAHEMMMANERYRQCKQRIFGLLRNFSRHLPCMPTDPFAHTWRSSRSYEEKACSPLVALFKLTGESGVLSSSLRTLLYSKDIPTPTRRNALTDH